MENTKKANCIEQTAVSEYGEITINIELAIQMTMVVADMVKTKTRYVKVFDEYGNRVKTDERYYIYNDHLFQTIREMAFGFLTYSVIPDWVKEIADNVLFPYVKYFNTLWNDRITDLENHCKKTIELIQRFKRYGNVSENDYMVAFDKFRHYRK